MPSRLRFVVLALASCVALLIALPGVGQAASTSVSLPTIPAVPGLPIPALPTDALVPHFIGAPATARPIAQAPIPQNPQQTRNGASSMHNDSYSSDSYAVSGPLGRNLLVTTASYGVRECATMSFDSHGRIEALCGSLEGFTMMLIDPVTLKPISELPMPARDLSKGGNPFTDICGGTYFFLTPDDHAIATTTAGEIWDVKQDGTKLVKDRSWDLNSAIPAGDCLVAVAPDWAGHVWFFTQGGVVGTLDRTTGAIRTVALGEGIFNSVSADETGGVYLVTTAAAYRMDADANGAPTVTWRSVYDRGSQLKPGMLSQGSGTSPTLIGKRWVVIADNAEPRMNVIWLDRRKGIAAGKRQHCKVPVFGAGASATENSLVAAGNSVMVENNYGYAGVQSTMFGQTTTPGFARVVLTATGCRVAWTNSTVVAPTSVPKSSVGNGLVYAYTKPATTGIDAWYFSAIDIRTGKVVWSKLTGTGIQWNNHYASVYLGPDGAAYMPVLSGLIRLKDR